MTAPILVLSDWIWAHKRFPSRLENYQNTHQVPRRVNGKQVNQILSLETKSDAHDF